MGCPQLWIAEPSGENTANEHLVQDHQVGVFLASSLGISEHKHWEKLLSERRGLPQVCLPSEEEVSTHREKVVWVYN